LVGYRAEQIDAARDDRPAAADTVIMNDYHIAILWLRSLELAVGHAPLATRLTKRDMDDLFVRYRSPYKA
jgi:hypothetical protein